MKLRRLNMDNSWMLSFGGLTVLIDPWLIGKEIDFFSWFNTQWHKTKPVDPSLLNEFDLVLITQKYPDHFHPETLKLLNPKTIVSPSSITKKLKKLLPSAEVIAFNKGVNQVLGSTLNIHFLPTGRKIDPIYDALLLEDGKESIILATHGFTESKILADGIKNHPPVTLLMSPFDHYQLPFFLGGTVAPGIEGLKKLVKTCKAKKIIATHDEDKHASGLVQWFAKITKAPSLEFLNEDPILKDKIIQIHHYNNFDL